MNLDDYERALLSGNPVKMVSNDGDYVMEATFTPDLVILDSCATSYQPQSLAKANNEAYWESQPPALLNYAEQHVKLPGWLEQSIMDGWMQMEVWNEEAQCQ